MSKDPAVLFYINDWLTSTAEMDADCRGWYLNLLLHNYDKKSLPNNLEKLAVLCNVKFSEYKRFEQVFEQVLKQKFEQVENNRLSNTKTDDILKSREVFKDKRSNAGKISYVMKFFAKNYNKEYKNKPLCLFVKDNFNYNIDLKDEQVLKHMFKHLFELYINENENENIVVNKNEDKFNFVDENKKVKLSKSQIDSLIEKYGNDGYLFMVSKLSNYKLSKGISYKSDYGAINSWVTKEWLKNKNDTTKKGKSIMLTDKMKQDYGIE